METHRLIRPSVHLPPSGNALRHFVAFPLPPLVLVGKPRHFRTRTYHAHVPLQHVDKLTKLVEAGTAQKRAHPRYARIIRLFDETGCFFTADDSVSVHVHRAELVDDEAPSMLPNTELPKNHRTGTFQPDRNG